MEEKWTYSLWGAAAGAAALAVIGFTLGGWMTGGNAEAMAQKRSQTAVVAVLTPICIQKFKANANASVKLAELKDIGVSWLRRDYIVSGDGRPSARERPFELADACAEALNKL